MGLGGEHVEDVGERFVEAGHALVFEGQSHLVHIDTDSRELVEHGGRVVDVAVDGAGDGAVVFEGGDGDFREGVDGVGSDEIVDVQRVGVAGVLR